MTMAYKLQETTPDVLICDGARVIYEYLKGAAV